MGWEHLQLLQCSSDLSAEFASAASWAKKWWSLCLVVAQTLVQLSLRSRWSIVEETLSLWAAHLAWILSHVGWAMSQCGCDHSESCDQCAQLELYPASTDDLLRATSRLDRGYQCMGRISAWWHLKHIRCSLVGCRLAQADSFAEFCFDWLWLFSMQPHSTKGIAFLLVPSVLHRESWRPLFVTPLQDPLVP